MRARTLLDMLGPVLRARFRRRGAATVLAVRHPAVYDWTYGRERPELARLYAIAKRSQWDAATAVDWSLTVDPHDASRELIEESILPLPDIPAYRRLPAREKQLHRRDLLAWMLGQFLHGEQGALFAACQVTQAAASTDAKLFGATQVADEGRHVEVFHRYLAEKLGKLYVINDNLYTIIDALTTDPRWDMKFLGMQIMIEGLALGAFGTLRAASGEPLLREILRYVITDEARHVHFGVLALEDFTRTIPERERRAREDWAFEIAVLLRDRFLAHEFYEERYAHAMSRAAWDRLVLGSRYMERFRHTMFRRLVPNLKRVGLLSARIRPHYERLGLLAWEREPAAPELTARDLL